MVDYLNRPKFRSSYSPGGPTPPPKEKPFSSPGAPPGGESDAPAAQNPPASRTTLPPRQHIRCFECGYEFNLTGRMTSTYCPKCRTTLDLAGYTIDTASSDTLKTLGTIRITRRGSVSGAHLLGTNIDLSGRIKDSLVQAFDALIIHPGADFVRKEIVSSDLRIEAGADVRLNNEAAYRHVEVNGRLRTHLYASGTVTLRAGSIFEGTIEGGHLVVEEGATVVADLNISEEGLRLAEKKFTELRENVPFAFASERIVVAVPPALESSEATPNPGQ